MINRYCVIMALMLTFLSLPAYAAQDYVEKLNEGEDPGNPVITEYKIDIDGDKDAEFVKVIYGPGVSDKALTIEVYDNEKLISTLQGKFGIQSNYKVEDIDGDGKKENIIWSGIWDFRMPGEDGITEDTHEGHSSNHRYIVATYKLIRGEYYLWNIYTTKKKYEPFCEEQPI